MERKWNYGNKLTKIECISLSPDHQINKVGWQGTKKPTDNGEATVAEKKGNEMAYIACAWESERET